MSEKTTAKSGRDWFKIGLLTLMPALVIGLFAVMLGWGSGDRATAAEPSTTTTNEIEVLETTTTTVVVEEPPPVPEDQTDEVSPEAPAEDEPADDGPDDPPADALLALPAEVDVDGEGSATIQISNLGELPLEIYLVDVNDNPIEVGDVATEVGAYSHEDVNLTVDGTDLPFGDYEMTVTISTNDGVGHVKVKGSKFFVFIPLLPDVDISTAYVVPHGANLLDIKMVNNEAHEVTVSLSSADDRLVFPESYELAPGENHVGIVIQALAVPFNVIDILELTVSYGATEIATVTITKHGS